MGWSKCSLARRRFGDAFDLDEKVRAGQRRLEGGSRREAPVGPVGSVERVHAWPVLDAGEDDGAFQDMSEVASAGFEHGADIGHDLLELGVEVVLHELKLGVE